MNLELVHNETTFMPFSSGLLSCASPGRLSDAGDLLCAHSVLLIPVARVRRRRRVHRIWDDVEMVGEDERTGEGDNGSEDQDEDEETDPENEEEDEYVPSTTRPSNALRQDDYLPDHLFKPVLSHAGKKIVSDDDVPSLRRGFSTREVKAHEAHFKGHLARALAPPRRVNKFVRTSLN